MTELQQIRQEGKQIKKQMLSLEFGDTTSYKAVNLEKALQSLFVRWNDAICTQLTVDIIRLNQSADDLTFNKYWTQVNKTFDEIETDYYSLFVRDRHLPDPKVKYLNEEFPKGYWEHYLPRPAKKTEKEK